MTDFFPFDELTWPEVAALRRDTPLVIPLGGGYDMAKLAEALGDPSAVGILPAIPYGWRGSGLAVPEAPFAQMVLNLLDSLADDGFSRVYSLHPQDIDLGLGPRAIIQRHSSQLRDTPPLPADADRDKYHRRDWPGNRGGRIRRGRLPARIPLRSEHPPPIIRRYAQRRRPGLRGFLAGRD